MSSNDTLTAAIHTNARHLEQSTDQLRRALLDLRNQADKLIRSLDRGELVDPGWIRQPAFDVAEKAGAYNTSAQLGAMITRMEMA